MKFLLLLLVPAMIFGASFDVQRFKPSFGLKGGMLVDYSETLEPFSYGGMFYLHYDKDPFVMEKNGDETSIVGNVFYGDMMFAMGIIENLEAGILIPISFYSSGQSPTNGDFSQLSMGDLQLGARYVLPTFFPKLGTGVSMRFTLPTGDTTSYNSNDGVSLFLNFFADYKLTDNIILGSNLGVFFRSESSEEDISQGSELSFKLGGKYIFQKDFEFLAELFGAFQASNPFDKREETPLELLLGSNYYYLSDIRFSGGLAFGLSPGVGTPLMRVILGVGYVQRDPDLDHDGILNAQDQCVHQKEDLDNFQDQDGCPELDNDKDGILDVQDKCPNKPEDIDQFEDSDGCPELDNDKDGIRDDKDRCPNKPESKNGIEDQDGCPEVDTDGDGLVDPVDKCPNEAEDKDGFYDGDGCPELDNDKDGIIDTQDKCPGTEKELLDKIKTQEDKDGFQDEDGCPELDNDQDGIIDAQDKCPNKPETYNGNKDKDGCPDKGKKLVQINVAQNKIEILDQVFFRSGSAKISRKSYKLLTTVASTIKNSPGIKKVRIEGHTDDVGRTRTNLRLSQKRAEAVRRFLIRRGRINSNRLVAKGYGPNKPVEDVTLLKKILRKRGLKRFQKRKARTKLRNARNKNRRVEFVIVD